MGKKKWLLLLAVVMMLAGVGTSLAAGFDLQMIEDPAGKYAGVFNIVRDGSNVFIDNKLTSPQKAFEHENESKYYYSTITSDMIVIGYRTAEEYVVPRIWINYYSEAGGIEAAELDVNIGSLTYRFSLDPPQTKQLEGGTVRETYAILLGKQSMEFMLAWCQAALNGETLSAKLRGRAQTIAFDIPRAVAEETGKLLVAHAAAGGTDSMDNVYATPVTALTADAQTSYPSYAAQSSDVEYVLDAFTVRFPETFYVWTVNGYRSGQYEDWVAGLFDDEETCLFATDYDELIIKISVDKGGPDMLRTTGISGEALVKDYEYILYGYDGKKKPAGEEVRMFKTETTNFAGLRYIQSGKAKWMLKYLWAHDGQTHYMTVDIGKYDKTDVTLDDVSRVLGYLESLNTL